MTPVEPLAPWLGGKRMLAQRLAAIIATIPHRTYVEPFMGMGGVFLRRAHAAPGEIVNDINRELITLFRVVQRHPEALIKSFDRWTLSSRQIFDEFKTFPVNVLTDIERSALFLYLQRLSFGGKVHNPSFGVDLSAGSRLRLATLERQIGALHRRLDGVIIECLPWNQVLERYDRPDTLFYLDPPYMGGEADYGRGIFSATDFTKMARLLSQLQGRFVLSINDQPESRRLFGDFDITEVSLNYSAGSRHGSGVEAKELIVRDRKGDAVGPLFSR